MPEPKTVVGAILCHIKDLREWELLEANIRDNLYVKAMSKEPADRTLIEGMWVVAIEKAGIHQYGQANKIAKNLVGLLEDILDESTSTVSGTDVIPKKIVALASLRIVIWENIRKDFKGNWKEILENIIDICDPDEDDEDKDELIKIKNEAEKHLKKMVSVLKEVDSLFDPSLKALIDDIINASVKTTRKSLTNEAIKKIDGYLDNFLKDHTSVFLNAIDDGAGGFGNVKKYVSNSVDLLRQLRSTLEESLL